MRGSEMHNQYPLLYNAAFYEAFERSGRADDLVCWGRSGWAGIQRYPVSWSGDMLCNFPSMACTLWSGLSFSLSGVPVLEPRHRRLHGRDEPRAVRPLGPVGAAQLAQPRARHHQPRAVVAGRAGAHHLPRVRRAAVSADPVPVQPGPRGPSDGAAAAAPDGAGVPGGPGHPHDRQPVPARPEPAGGPGPGGGAAVEAGLPAERHLVQLLDGHRVRGRALDPAADAASR